ncbi:MAG TPA: 30S ribosomal protein S16 [Acidimicrobiia bacterium]|nr:30S ribosomal protein S16 [Acidimicrobiia bacterium]
MSVKLRLTRVGKKKNPMYRVVVADERAPRDGRFIEIIGQYQPLEEPSMINIKDDRALYWLGQGAQPSETVQKILAVSGVWAEYEKTQSEKTKAKAKAALAARAKATKKAPKKEVAEEPAAPEASAPAAQEATPETETTETTESTESE